MAAARARTRVEAPKNDVYTGMLLISLAAMLIASLLLCVDFSFYQGFTASPPDIPSIVGPSTTPPPGPPGTDKDKGDGELKP